MRELTLLESGYLAALLLVSLGLPVWMSLRGPVAAGARSACMKMVWVGQGWLMLAGGVIFLSAAAAAAPYATVIGLLGYAVWGVGLGRRFRWALK